MNNQFVKGFSLKNELKFYQKKLGIEKFDKVRHKFPIIDNLSTFKRYSRFQELEIMIYIGSLLYKDKQEAFEHFGHHVFNYFTQNPIGKTFLSLFKNDVKKVILNIDRAFNTISSGIQVISTETGFKSVRIEMKDENWPAIYYKTILEDTIRFYGLSPTVTEQITNNHYIFDLSWN